MRPRVGILALQGSFQEHADLVSVAGETPVLIKLPRQLEGVHALIIPGGESTTIRKLMHRHGLDRKIVDLAGRGLPIYGTCAGMIVLAREIEGPDPPILALMDIVVRRNAFGRQRESFEERLSMPVLGPEPFDGVFIRAPRIRSVGAQINVLARRADGEVVAVEQGHLLASSFHPELTGDPRIHRYFLSRLQTSQRLRRIDERKAPTR